MQGPAGPFDGSGTLYQGFHGDDPAVCADWVCPGHDVATTEKKVTGGQAGKGPRKKS